MGHTNHLLPILVLIPQIMPSLSSAGMMIRISGLSRTPGAPGGVRMDSLGSKGESVVLAV